MPTDIVDHNNTLCTDTAIVSAVLSGKTALFEILIRRYNPYLYKIGRSYGFNHQDTEDAMQETFINSYINLGQFRQQASFKTWLFRIMLNQCYHRAHRKRYQKEKPAEPLRSKSDFMFLRDTESSNAVINKELNKVIETCLMKLPEAYRTTFALRELTGLNMAETAEVMHTTVANVKVRLNRAKAMLQKEIEQVYTPEEIYEFNLIYCDKMVNAVMQKIAALPKKN